jgi:hypothetical protein
MAGFSGLGLGYLGDEKKYFGEPGPDKMPGLLQGIIDVPANYLAKEYGKPAVEWVANKLGMAPPASVANAPAIPPNMTTINTKPFDQSIQLNALHPEVELSAQTDLYK